MNKIGKIKRISPSLLTEEERRKGLTELSRNLIAERQKNLYSKKAFFAISLSNKEFSVNEENINLWRTKTILHWLSNTFDDLCLLVSDSLYKYYYQVILGLPEKVALNKGESEGVQIIKNLNSTFNSLGIDESNFRIIRWSSITSEKNFNETLLKFESLSNEDKELRDSITKSAEAFLERNRKKIKIELLVARKILIEGIIEELAVFAYMGQKGYETHVYSSSFLEVLKNISNGLHKNVPTDLSQQDLIQIKLINK